MNSPEFLIWMHIYLLTISIFGLQKTIDSLKVFYNIVVQLSITFSFVDFMLKTESLFLIVDLSYKTVAF